MKFKLQTQIKTFTIIVLICLFAGSCKKDSVQLSESQVTPNNFLSSSKYDKLIVEVQYVNGFEPTNATIDKLTDFLEARLNKNGGISVVKNAVSSPGKGSLSISDIRAFEKTHRTKSTEGNVLTAYFLFVDGEYNENSGNSKVLGVAYGNTSMVIFEKTIKDFSGGLGEPSETTLESIVTQHEFGHILGLTNNGTGMQTQHQDEVHGKHCNVQNCLMYYTAETSDMIANIIGSNVPALDAQCIADLRANGGK